MPQASTITINDRESTPVAHVFTPDSEKDGVWTFREITGVPVGENMLTNSLKRSTGKIRVRTQIKCPIVQTETVNGISAPTVIRASYGSIELTFAETSTLQERKNLVGLLANALSAAQATLNLVHTENQQYF